MLSVSGRPRSLPEVSPAPLGTARQGRVGHRGAPRTLTSTLFFKNSSEAAVLTGAACFPCRAWGRREVGGRGSQTRGDERQGPGRGQGRRRPLTFFTDSEMFSRIRSFTSRGSMAPPPPPRRRFPRRAPGAAANRCRRPCGDSVVPAAGPGARRPRFASPGPRSAAASRARSREGDADCARRQELMSGGAAPAPAGRDGRDRAGPPPPSPGPAETCELRDSGSRRPGDLETRGPRRDHTDPGPHRAGIT